jgi:hypothetical protein
LIGRSLRNGSGSAGLCRWRCCSWLGALLCAAEGLAVAAGPCVAAGLTEGDRSLLAPACGAVLCPDAFLNRDVVPVPVEVEGLPCDW